MRLIYLVVYYKAINVYLLQKSIECIYEMTSNIYHIHDQ